MMNDEEININLATIQAVSNYLLCYFKCDYLISLINKGLIDLKKSL